VEAAVAEVKRAATADENVIPKVMDAVEGYATVGEICAALVEVYGRFDEPIRF